MSCDSRPLRFTILRSDPKVTADRFYRGKLRGKGLLNQDNLTEKTTRRDSPLRLHSCGTHKGLGRQAKADSEFENNQEMLHFMGRKN